MNDWTVPALEYWSGNGIMELSPCNCYPRDKEQFTIFKLYRCIFILYVVEWRR